MKRGKGLERRTRLRPESDKHRAARLAAPRRPAPPRRPEKPTLARKRPIRQRSAATAAWDAWRDQERDACMWRATPSHMGMKLALPRCEWPGCMEPGLEWHHTCGRRGKVAEPWASSRVLTCMLCTDHHRLVTDTAQGRRAMRWQALERFLVAMQLRTGTRPLPEYDSPDIFVAAEHYLLRAVNQAHTDGIAPPHLEDLPHGT